MAQLSDTMQSALASTMGGKKKEEEAEVRYPSGNIAGVVTIGMEGRRALFLSDSKTPITLATFDSNGERCPL